MPPHEQNDKKMLLSNLILNDYYHSWPPSRNLALSLPLFLFFLPTTCTFLLFFILFSPSISFSASLNLSLPRITSKNRTSNSKIFFNKFEAICSMRLNSFAIITIDCVHFCSCRFFIFAHFRELKIIASIERNTVEKSILHLFNWCRWRCRSHSLNVFLWQVCIHCTKFKPYAIPTTHQQILSISTIYFS